MYDKVVSYAGETTELDEDLIDLEKLLDDDIFMLTAPWVSWSPPCSLVSLVWLIDGIPLFIILLVSRARIHL